MTLSLPSDFQPALAHERLSQVASWLLEEWSATQDDLVRETDSSYSRGTTTFDRQKNRIINECRKGQYNWLGIVNGANDLVFSIGGINCRFSNDSAKMPKKRAVLETHRFQMSLLDSTAPGHAARFCFVIDRGPTESSDRHVELLGYSSANELVCRWSSATMVRTLVGINDIRPEPIEIAKPIIAPKRINTGDAADAAAGP
jgi:hypothetical protein